MSRRAVLPNNPVCFCRAGSFAVEIAVIFAAQSRRLQILQRGCVFLVALVLMSLPLSRGASKLLLTWCRSQQVRLMSDSIPEFSSVLQNAKKIVVLSGAGISAESGIPTFRGEGGLWRAFDATELATPGAFAANPSLVWEFYHYRRTIVARSVPNAGHYAVAALQRRCRSQDKEFILLTQNIDGLHLRAGSTDVVELHGSMWKTRCCHCEAVETNRDMPICAALDGKGSPDTSNEANIASMDLPRCKKCNGLLRPHVVWFGECLERDVVNRTNDALRSCDLLLVVGTSAVVYPAAGYAPMVKAHGGVVAEFNTEDTPISYNCRFKFQGASSVKLPSALGIGEGELAELEQHAVQ